jgi:hypothetical protein
MTERARNTRRVTELHDPSTSRSRQRRPHPARTARIVCTGMAATMTLGTMTALTLADVSSANQSVKPEVSDQSAYDAANATESEYSPAVEPQATPGPEMQSEPPTTIVVVRRIHIVSRVQDVQSAQTAPTDSSAVPVPTAATVPLPVATFAPKPVVRRATAVAKPKLKTTAKTVRTARPKVRVRKAKPATRSS